MSTALNGHVAEQPAAQTSVTAQIEEHVTALDALLVPLRAERDQLKAQLDDLNRREKAIIHATAALRGSTHTPAAAEPKPTRPGWTPSEESLKRVFALFTAESGPVSPTQLAEKTDGISTETVTKGAKVLRERELLRVCGKIRGGGSLYAVMDGAEWPS